MELEMFLSTVFRVTVAILFTGGCAMVVVLTSVYGYKVAMRGIKGADRNLDGVQSNRC